MGTSTRHRSPSTPIWDAVHTSYKSASIAPERLTHEVWRAASLQPGERLPKQLESSIVHTLLRTALTSESPEEGIAAARRVIAKSHTSSLATDIAQRALVQSFTDRRNQVAGFAHSLFVEAVTYLVSRDLPGYVGTGERLPTISDAISLKSKIRDVTLSNVRSVPIPPGVEETPAKWKSYTRNVIALLTAHEKK